MSGDSGDSSSDFSAKPSCSRRISTRRSKNNASAAATASSSSSAATNAMHGGCGGGKKKRRIVMRIEFDDDSEDSMTSGSSSGQSDYCNRKVRNVSKANRTTKRNSAAAAADEEDDDIKPCSSRKLRGKLGKKTNFVFSNDESNSGDDDVPAGSNRKVRRNRQRLLVDDDDDDEDDIDGPGCSRDTREIARTLRHQKKLGSSDDDDDDEPGVAAPSTSTSQPNPDEENGFNSDSSSNELLEKCPICLLTFRAQEIGSPATCEHIFCANCIEAWSKNVQTCPIDRIEFDRIIVRESYESRKLVREINVCKESGGKPNLDLSEEELTQCEVCSRTDREDVMLLCDSCNHGYHIDCLNPSLPDVPEGSWYCDNCFDTEDEDSDLADDLNVLYEDIRDMGIPETRLRVTEVHQPRILRTRQNERIRATILSRTRSSARNQSADVAAPSSSRTASASRSARTLQNSTRTARTTKTRRRRRRRARQRTYVVEYDLNNYDEKFAIKTTKKVIRRRRRRRTQRTARSCRAEGSGGRMTASKRLAEQLGITATDREARSAVSSQNFSLFGNANDLEYFSDSDDGDRLQSEVEIETGGGGTAVQTSVRISNFRTHHRSKKGLLSRLERAQPSSAPDLLSNIMDMQDRWHNASRHLDAVRIGQDGSLNLPPPSAEGGSPAVNPSPTVAPETQPSSAVNSNEITQAPMYPRGGGGNNRNFSSGGGNSGGGGGNYNNRYNNQSNYRGGGGGGGNSGGGQYRNSFGSSSGTGSGSTGGTSGNLFNMVGRGNFSFSSQSNDNNSNNTGNNNTPNNRNNRFNNQRNNNNNNRNQRNSLPYGNNQSNDDNLASSNVSQSPLQQRQNIPIQPTQQGQFQHQLTPSVAPSLLTMPPIQPPVGLYTSLPPPTSGLPPPPLYGPPTMQIPPLMSQPPPIMPMRPQQPTVMPLPAPPSFNSSLLQLTADYGNDDDDDSNCPNFSVYSMESLQVAKSDINAAAESKGDTPKEDDENEDLVQLSDDDETMATGNDEIPLPPSVENAEDSANNKDNDLYEPDQPTVETDDESANDDQNKDQGDDEEESQKSPPENDMELDSEDTVSPPTSSKKPAEEADAKNSTADGAADDERNLLDIKLPTEGTKVKRAPRKGVLELYDDSDWEELNMERPTVRGQTPPQLENETHEKDVENHNDEDEGEEKEEGHTPDHSTPLANKEKSSDEKVDEEGDKEQDRSYTPCLDEKNDDIDDEENNDDGARTPELAGPSTANLNTSKDANTSDQAAGIAGMETELISEDDDADKRDKRKRSKSGKDKEQFKKVSKNQKDRNYRSDKPHEDRSKSRRRRSRSRTNDKENQGMSRRRYQRGGGRFKRREMPRYNVRNIVNQQRTFKDRYGRDTSRPARSTSRTRRRRSFSRSNSRSKSRSRSSSSSGNKRVRRSFSISPSPPRFVGNRRQSVSPPRRRSHSPVRNRSPIRRQSRTPLRMRSRSNSPTRRFKHTKGKRAPGKRSLSPPVNRARSLSRFTPRLSRSRTPPRHKGKRPKDRKKKKAKKRQASPSPPPDNGRGTPPRRVSRRRDSMPPNKRKRHHTPKANSPVVDQGWSPSPSPARQYGHDNISWTPPLMSPAGISRLRRNDEFNEFSITSKPPKEKKKREKKKKKAEKRRTEISRKEKRRRNPSGTAPSKEVFASGNNILVSVSFNKDGNQPQQTTVVTLPPTREEVLASIRGRSKDRQNDTQNKKKKKKGTERKRKKLDTKPVAIIDLERSPFQITQEQTDIIVLTDSEGGGHDDENLNVSRESANDMTEMDHHHVREGSSHRTVNSDKTPPLERLETIMEESYENAIQQQGPKTPPEPPGGIKFNLINKSKAKAIRNALHDDAELESDEHHDEERQEERDSLTQNSNKIGPNTPPESGPCSPDVYDPFDPTKSPSLSPRSPTPPLDMSHDSVPDNDVPSKHSTEDLRSGMTASSGTSAADKNALNPVDLVMALMNNKANTSQDSVNKSDSQYNSGPVVVSLLDENDKPEENISTMGITVLSNVILSSGKTQHIPSISSPPLSKASSNKQQPKITNILSGLPGLRHNGDDAMNDIESPYSPGSADYEDLFEPPPDTNGGTKRRRDKRSKAAAGGDVFSDLFGSSTPPPTGAAHLRLPRKYKAAHTATKNKHKMIVKVGKLPGNNNDEHVKVYDDLPNSAVELQVKDKFLRKLNRQERVVEEVKTILKPKFNKKQITKDDYKEIMRRAVPKICHSKSGEINPKKIQNLIDAYVKKFRQKHKKLNIPNTGQVSSAVKCAAYLKKL